MQAQGSGRRSQKGQIIIHEVSELRLTFLAANPACHIFLCFFCLFKKQHDLKGEEKVQLRVITSGID
eukprot:scaffold146346_cov18-Tisochrysis_lutea.AAC.2